MKIIRHGKIYTFEVVCPCCKAELECNNSDIAEGTGETVPCQGNFEDYSDTPGLRTYTDPIVDWVLRKYRHDYVERGHYATRDAVIICPECGHHIDLRKEKVPVMDSIFPASHVFSTSLTGCMGASKGISRNEERDNSTVYFGKNVELYKPHVEEYNELKKKKYEKRKVLVS